jgi:uncharacterized membrane protein
MTMRKYIVSFVLGACVLLPALAASASIKVCNKSGREIWAAYGEKIHPEESREGHIWGWYHLQPNQCATVISGCACNFWADLFNNCWWDYMFHANDAAGAQWTSGEFGSTAVCTSFSAFSEEPRYDWQGHSCVAPRAWRGWGIGGYPTGSFCDFTFNFRP